MICEICKRDFSNMVAADSGLLDTKDIQCCFRCSNSLKNLDKLVKYFDNVEDKTLRDKYIDMIKSLLYGSTTKQGERTVGLLEAPAGRRVHHSYTGGLLSHIIQMIEFCFTTYHYKSYPFHGCLHKGDIVIGCLLHDLHKARHTFIKETKKGIIPFRYAKANEQLIPEIETMYICTLHSIPLTEEHCNTIFGAHGIFATLGKNIILGKLATLIHIADMYSAHILKK